MYNRIKTINGHQYRYQVKAIREGKRVKQIYVCYLGRVEYLKEIKQDTSILHDIKQDTSMLPEVKRDTSVLPAVKSGIDSLNTKFDTYMSEQREHNKHLEKILEKLAEK